MGLYENLRKQRMVDSIALTSDDAVNQRMVQEGVPAGYASKEPTGYDQVESFFRNSPIQGRMSMRANSMDQLKNNMPAYNLQARGNVTDNLKLGAMVGEGNPYRSKFFNPDQMRVAADAQYQVSPDVSAFANYKYNPNSYDNRGGDANKIGAGINYRF